MGELNFSIEQIKELMAAVADQNIESLEVKQDDFKIKITANSTTQTAATPQFWGGQQTGHTLTDIEESQVDPQAVGTVIKSPIVGTFYESPAPDKAAYVKVGDKVGVGDILYIVESMKLMNEVLSEYSGIIKEIMVKNEEPIEYGQPIMIIE